MMRCLLIISLLAAILISCGNNEKSAEKKVKQTTNVILSYEPIIVKDSVWKDLINNGERSEKAAIVRYEYFKITDSSKVYEENVNDWIKENAEFFVFGEENRKAKNVSIGKDFFLKLLNSFSDSYYEFGDEEYSVWNLDASISIDNTFDNFVYVNNFVYSFAGGAHGNAVFDGAYFEKLSGQRLKLKDFFKDTKKLTQIAEKYFRLAMEMPKNQTYEEAGFWFENDRFFLNENFSFSENSIEFTYGQYEIAPYSMGMPSFEIPINEVKHLLKINLVKTKTNT